MQFSTIVDTRHVGSLAWPFHTRRLADSVG